MLSRKHYKAIAKIIWQLRIAEAHADYIDTSDLINSLMAYFKTDNPEFNREKFERACEGE
jgi:hypothetical protein